MEEKPKFCKSFNNQQNTKTYFYYYKSDPYEVATKNCKQYHNGRLAVIKGEATFTELVENAPLPNYGNGCFDNYLAIGLQKTPSDDRFKWVDGSYFQNGRRKISIRDDAGDCNVVNLYIGRGDVSKARFIALNCSGQFSFICERNIRTTSSSTASTSSSQSSTSNNKPNTNDQNQPNTSSAALIGGLVAGIIFLLLFVIGIVIIRKRKNRQNYPSPAEAETRPEEVYYSSVDHGRLDAFSPPEYASIEDGLQPGTSRGSVANTSEPEDIDVADVATYAVVKKKAPKQKPGNSASVYSFATGVEAEDEIICESDKNEADQTADVVYSVVNKKTSKK